VERFSFRERKKKERTESKATLPLFALFEHQLRNFTLEKNWKFHSEIPFKKSPPKNPIKINFSNLTWKTPP
jgi:hypothetical protein